MYPSLTWRAISAKLEEETLSEEMRVLYVAMTRARERLYISSVWSDARSQLDKLREGLSSPVDHELLRSDASVGCWLLRAAALPGSPMELELPEAHEADAAPVRVAPDGGDRPLRPAADMAARLEWRYPFAWAESLPSKLTASSLEGREGPDPDAGTAFPVGEARPSLRRPVLGEPGALTEAEKGSAVHTLMQFIDFKKCADGSGVRSEIARLLLAGHLTAAQAAAAEADMVLGFFRSALGRRVLSADRVWRELRFSMLVGAETFFDVPPGERVLLQGVVDCCFREGDALTVVDYKTDRVTRETLEEKGRLYAPQLRAYAVAMERMLGLPVKECAVYFLRTGMIWRETGQWS
jgi:ATP-dependent helicase/nuclease subunit A